MKVCDALNNLRKQELFDARMRQILDERFQYLNLNPNNEKIGDCVIRAIAKAYNMPYEKVVEEIQQFNMFPKEDSDGTNEFAGLWYNLSRIIDHFGYKDYIEGYLLERPLIRDFIKDHPKGTYLIGIAKPQHLTVLVDGTIYDTWDCTGKTIEEVWVIDNGKVTEDFPDEEHKNGHFQKHCIDNDPNEFTTTDYIDADKYEEAANELALTDVDSADIRSSDRVVGFIQKDGAYVKYNKSTRGLVKYKPDTRFGKNVKIITYYKATPMRYQKILSREFGRYIK